GGAIRVKVGNLAGSGVISARGGDSGKRSGGSDSNARGGGGGGGRVVVRAKTSTFPLSSVDVGGGVVGAVGTGGNNGGRGTFALIALDPAADVAVDDTRAGDRALTIASGFRFQLNDANDAPLSYDAITVTPGSQVVGSDASLTITTPSLTVTSATWDIGVASYGGCDGTCETATDVVTLAVGDLTLTDA
ncbi:MAG: hypothetical protein KC635_04000, partial [Myxococcales bacterium]|nr:hypothetical protein [Myxococcales bacterium]